MYIVDTALESDTDAPIETAESDQKAALTVEANGSLVAAISDLTVGAPMVAHVGNKDGDLADLDLQESFSRFRSRSEGSGLGFPRKSLLKKNSEPDALKLCRRVSFADSNGFELEQVRSFDTQPPGSLEVDDDDREDFLLPSAMSNGHSQGNGNGGRGMARPSGERRFVPYFSLPWSSSTGGKHSLVYAALEDRKVCLEAFTIHSSWRISGTILVKNISFHKRVFVRRTMDKWRTYRDVDAVYVCSVNENVDRFHFELHFAFKLPPGTRLEVALGYETPGQGRGEYWDNNCDNNYAFWFNDKL